MKITGKRYNEEKRYFLYWYIEIDKHPKIKRSLNHHTPCTVNQWVPDIYTNGETRVGGHKAAIFFINIESCVQRIGASGGTIW